jgi:two-component system, sensor histidine kinase and response regulator
MTSNKFSLFLLSKWANPLLTAFSISVSILFYTILYLSIPGLSETSSPWIGFVVSFIIPALVSPPIIFVSNKLLQKLHDNNINMQKLNDELEKSHLSLKQSNIHREALFSVISHDFRSPLASLTGFITVAKEGFLDAEMFPKILNDIESKNTVLLEMIDSLLIWSEKQMKGDTKLSHEKLNVKELIDTTLKLYDLNIKEKNVVVNNLSSKEDTIWADNVSMALIIRNLFSNALKFIPAQTGVISISFQQSETESTLLIQDNGVGMTEKEVDALMNNNSLNTTTNGTSGEQGHGIGFFLCNFFIEKNGGILECQSVKGEGTTFKIKLSKGKS